MRILLVDDDPEVRELLKRAFERCGWCADSAGGLLEAGVRLRESLFDVIVTELHLGNRIFRNGLELARFIDEAHPGTPVILFTSTVAEAGLAGLPASIVTVVGKPDFVSLRAAVERIGAGRQALADRLPSRAAADTPDGF